MNNDFPRILTLLRKERGYSQKKVAGDLGISQALLSHYEKGIRECGLDFIVRAADYYNVSCDYMLGRTPQRNGSVITIQDLPGSISPSKNKRTKNTPLEYQHRLLSNTLYIVFSILKKINSESLTQAVSLSLALSLYKTFRVLYSSGVKNPQGLFKLDPRLFGASVESCRAMTEAKTRYILNGDDIDSYLAVEKSAIPQLTPEGLTNDFPQHAASLFDLIRNTEKAVKLERQ